MCRLTPCPFSSSSVSSASLALRNMRSSFGVMITSPGPTASISRLPSGRSASGTEPTRPLDKELVHRSSPSSSRSRRLLFFASSDFAALGLL